MEAAETAPRSCHDEAQGSTASRSCAQRFLLCLTALAASSTPAWLDVQLARGQSSSPAVMAPPSDPVLTPAPVVTGPVQPQPEVQAVAPYVQPALAEPPPVAEPPPPPPDVQKLEEQAQEEPSLLKPVLKLGLGVRTGVTLDVNNNADNVQIRLDDGVVDMAMLRPYFSAQLTKNVGLVGNFQFGPDVLGAAVLDAIVQVKIVDELQIWGGQHIPAQDRVNFQGPFFNNGWNFQAPGVQQFPWDNGARDRGFTIWGLIAKGFLKYHVSMVDLEPGRNIENAAFAGRVTLNFLDPENYYYTSGTYYGAQDTLALGGFVRGQKGTGIIDGSTPTRGHNDFLAGGVDLLAEKRYSSGVYTLQAQYINMSASDAAYVVNQGTSTVGKGVYGPLPGQSVFAEVSWLSPRKLGPGQLQPNFHFAWAGMSELASLPGTTLTYDVGIGYIIDGFNHRYYLNYRHVDHERGSNNDQLQIGAQLQI